MSLFLRLEACIGMGKSGNHDKQHIIHDRIRKLRRESEINQIKIKNRAGNLLTLSTTLIVGRKESGFFGRACLRADDLRIGIRMDGCGSGDNKNYHFAARSWYI